MSKLVSMQVFCCAANTLNFSQAADKMHISSAMVSKHVAYLEQRLGVQLFNRTTRKVQLTEKGLRYYQRCQEILDELEQLESGMGENDSEIHGRLHISLPMDFGVDYIAPLVSRFLQQYPRVTLDMEYDDRFSDLIGDNFDLAIRISALLADSSLVAKKLHSTQTILCASPDYLQAHHPIHHADDLARHNCLEFSNASDRSHWRLLSAQGEQRIKIRGNLLCNSGKAIMEATLNGLGIAMLPRFMTDRYIEQGKLIQILPHYRVPQLGIYAIYPRKAFLPSRVRVFIDFLQQNLRLDPELRQNGQGTLPDRTENYTHQQALATGRRLQTDSGGM